jgi:hypothetical protein
MNMLAPLQPAAGIHGLVADAFELRVDALDHQQASQTPCDRAYTVGASCTSTV